jgi:two-component system response regulator AtoC
LHVSADLQAEPDRAILIRHNWVALVTVLSRWERTAKEDMPKILIVDDEPAMVMVLSEALKQQRHEVVTANSADKALKLAYAQQPDLVIADIEMPAGKASGLDLLRKIKEYNPSIPVIMITGEATLNYAVMALRERAHDFIYKPFKVDEVINRVENALIQQRAVHALQENVELKQQLREKFRFDNIIGNSARMEQVYRLIERVANTDSTILLLGESGTGKELVAKALHYNSRRAAKHFVAVNCAALPEHLLESELFGHRKGAFTGAALDKIGLFQHADGGTIFLDEIGSMALSLQSKLLRFLQDKELRRVGDTKTTKVDVRMIAATNEPLQERLKQKNFREDLYYRISVIPIELPTLRDRTEDIPLLATHFVQLISQSHGGKPPRIADDVMTLLKVYRWPGNVRELQNAMERACALCDDGVITLKDLPERLLEKMSGLTTGAADRGLQKELADSVAGAAIFSRGGPPMSLKDFLHQQELFYIAQTVKAAGGDKDKAAELLGISSSTLYRKITEAEQQRRPR